MGEFKKTSGSRSRAPGRKPVARQTWRRVNGENPLLAHRWNNPPSNLSIPKNNAINVANVKVIPELLRSYSSGIFSDIATHCAHIRMPLLR